MGQIAAPLAGSYDGRLVLLSIFIAISASYVALDLGGRVTAARGWVRSAWLAGGAAAMGLGIWSMHFTGMLAFSLPVPVAYHWPTVLLSLLAAIFAAAIALYVVSRKKMDRVQALTGSVLMGLGIVLMHYIGMAAMRFSAECHYNLLLVALSLLIAMIASLAALVLTFDYREDFRETTLAKVLSAGVMGAAIFLMHYTGMMSASFIPSAVLPDLSHAVSITSLGLGCIAIGALAVQAAAILTSSADRRFAIQAQELQTSDRFRQIADNLQVVLALANADFTELLYVNHTYQVIWGRTLQSVYAEPKSWLEGIHPEDRGHIEESLQRLIGGEPIDNLECRVVRPDGSTSWVACQGFPIRDAEGHVYRLVASAQDITDRKRSEQLLRESEDRYRDLVEHSTDLICTYNLQGRLLSVNELTAKILGYSREELLNKPMRDFLLPEARAQFDESLINIQRDGFVKGLMVVLAKNGERRIWEYHNTLRTEGVTEPIVRGMAHDITERKRVEKELRKAQARIESVLRSVADTHILFDQDWHYLYVNEAAIRAIGRPRERILGRTLWELFPDIVGTELDRQYRRAMDERISVTFEFHYPTSNTRWENRFYPAPEGLAVFATDITERKRAEEELQLLSGKLLRLQDEERRKIARDLHDSTGQDLVVLAMMLGQLSGSIPSGERGSRRLLSECKALADKCLREVRTLSYELHSPVLEDAGLEDAIRDYVKGFTKRSGIQVELELSPRVGRMPRDVELALYRVMQEALTNIRRHSGSQRAKIRIHRNSDLTLEISDLGRGVSAGGQRGKEEPRLEVGVGIPSMQERVKLIGGRLEIDSNNHGTTVRVTIPLEKNEREKAAHSGS